MLANSIHPGLHHSLPQMPPVGRHRVGVVPAWANWLAYNVSIIGYYFEFKMYYYYFLDMKKVLSFTLTLSINIIILLFNLVFSMGFKDKFKKFFKSNEKQVDSKLDMNTMIDDGDVDLTWKEIKIFISSTFRDMNAERNYLITEVFPELREWCRKRKIILTDIDLRWGVTPDDEKSGNTINVCLQTINECHPFFLCFIGQRRGWVPDINQVKISPQTCENFPHIKNYLGELSITEMEIEHATLAPMIKILENDTRNEYSKRSLFFFRQNPFKNVELTPAQREVYFNSDPQDDNQLSHLKKVIVDNNNNVFNYTCQWDENLITDELIENSQKKGKLTNFQCNEQPLKDTIISQLKIQIQEEFPNHKPFESDDEYLEEAMLQNLEVELQSKDFIGRQKELEYLDNYLFSNSQKPLLLIGEDGIGKSKLLSYWRQSLKERGIGSIIRICNETVHSNSLEDLYLSIGSEAGLFNGEKEKYTNRHMYFNKQFYDKLKSKGIDVLIISKIDKINQYLSFGEVPSDFKLVLSCENDRFIQDYERFYLKGFENNDEQLSMIEKYTNTCLKSFDEEQKNLIISNNKLKSPLFLNILLNELKSFGSYEMLNQKILSFGSDVDSAFTEVLNTLENNITFPQNFVVDVLLMLVYSRYGLTEYELLLGLKKLKYSDDIKFKLRILLYHIKYYLTRKNDAYVIKFSRFEMIITKKYNQFENDIRQVLIEIYKEEILNNSNASSEKTLTSKSTDLFLQLELLGDLDGILEVFENENLLNAVHPSIYLMEYKNNQSYGQIFPFKTPDGLINVLRLRNYLGCNLKDDVKGREILREISLMLGRKTNELMYETNEKYSAYRIPKHELVEKFRKEDPEEFRRYQTSYYEIPSGLKASALYAILAIANESDDVLMSEFIKKYKKTISDVSSFMGYLSKFGNSQLGLSGSIEIRADSAMEVVEILSSYE